MTEYENRIKSVLGGIVHPETGEDIVSSGIVEHITANGQDAVITLAFRKRRDPFANSIKRQVTAAVTGAFPELAGKIAVTEKEEAPAPPVKEKVSSTAGIRHILAIASGKGGVGKSTVTANLAVTLRDMGYSVGILDADIYGPSMPKMFGVEGYTPQAILRDEQEYILPAETGGIKIASIGFFISPDDALIWRGPMATTALKQLLHQTLWEGLDYLLIDLPPGTGDVHLSVVGEVKVNGAIVVSTPQQVAVADVRRGVNMFRAEGIDVHPDAGPAVRRVYLEKVDGPHGPSIAAALYYHAQLLGLVNVVLLVFDESAEHIFRERRDGIAHLPDARVVLPLVEHVDILRLKGPQPDGIRFENVVHGYNPITWFLMSMAAPRAPASPPICDSRNFVSL